MTLTAGARTPGTDRVEDVAWDIDTLIEGAGADDDREAGIEALLDRAESIANDLQRFRGRIVGLDASELAELMTKSAEIQDVIGRAGSYASLAFAADTASPVNGARMQRVQERATAIGTELIFVELEWASISDERAHELLADEQLAFCRHHLRSALRYRPHLLSEPEERIDTEKDVSGRSAWVRLFSELQAAITVDLGSDGGTVSLERALSLLASPDRSVREHTAGAITAGLQPGLRTRSYIYNTLLLDKSVDDRLRKYPSWIASRNLSNEASDESVVALIDAVHGRRELAQRWYRLKAQLLGIDQLADFDRMASVVDEDPSIEWADARSLVLDSYRAFSPAMADVGQRFFDEAWIDAPVRPGKRPGAFCAYTVPSHHPYLLLNWTSKARDVMTLAHELGHGVHAFLSRGQGVYHQGTPLTLAETASVFGETLTFNRLLAQTTDPSARLSLLAQQVEGAIATVFRQIAMNRFEDRAHIARREEGELSVERFGELWAETQTDMFDDSFVVTDGYRSWWSYVPHFIGSPGYVYAYAYGQLLALAVYARYEAEGAAFAPRYLELLHAGGSMPPEDLGRIVGCDLADPAFWDGGLSIIEQQIEAAEDAARAAGRA